MSSVNNCPSRSHIFWQAFGAFGLHKFAERMRRSSTQYGAMFSKKCRMCAGVLCMSAGQKLEPGTRTRTNFAMLGPAEKRVCKRRTSATFSGTRTIFIRTVPIIFGSVNGALQICWYQSKASFSLSTKIVSLFLLVPLTPTVPCHLQGGEPFFEKAENTTFFIQFFFN